MEGGKRGGETYVMSDVGGFDHFVHLFEIGLVGVQSGEIVEHEAFELVFAARGVGVNKRANSSGVLGPLDFSVWGLW